jgi:hypothetical protein
MRRTLTQFGGGVFPHGGMSDDRTLIGAFAGRRLTLRSDPGSRALSVRPCGEWTMLPAGEVLSFGDQLSLDCQAVCM